MTGETSRMVRAGMSLLAKTPLPVPHLLAPFSTLISGVVLDRTGK